MEDQITISRTLPLRECGRDENWLQNEIEKSPTILGLGNLRVVHREKQQSGGGRLDFLLESQADGGMYEVEVMLGTTDESHIIRSIEYWDLERRRWPRRQHTAVLVAEKINRRFFNVIQLLSLTIPIIAIQANLVEADGRRVLHFTTILDAYQEPATECCGQTKVKANELVDELYWKKTGPWTLSQARVFQKVVGSVIGKLEMTFHKDAVRLHYDGEIYFRLNGRKEAGKSLFYTWLRNEVEPATIAVLRKNHVAYSLSRYDARWRTLRIEIEQRLVQDKAKVFRKIAELVRESWRS